MDNPPNPIFSLAVQVLKQRISLDSVLGIEVPKLLRTGIVLTDLLDAQLEALQPECPSLLRSRIAHICAAIAAGGALASVPVGSLPKEIACELSPSHIHLCFAVSLEERTDRQSLQLATEHYRAARGSLAPAEENYSLSLLQEGDVRRRLAEHGVDPLYNLALAVEHARQARRHLANDSHAFGVAEMNEGIAHDLFANFGISPKEHLENAVSLYSHARSLFQSDTEEFAGTQVNEAASWVYLSEIGVDPIKALNSAVRLCEAARRYLSEPTHGFGLALLNEGQARRGLAEWEERPIDNLRTAVLLFRQAQARFQSQEPDWRLAVTGEAGALSDLAERGFEAIANLDAALMLLQPLKGSSAPGTLPYCEQNIFEARLHLSLARRGVMPETNLSSAIELCQAARQGFDATGRSHARARTIEANAHMFRAELNVSPEENHRIALHLYEESERAFNPGTSNWAMARRNASRALWRLGLWSEAYERLKTGLAILDDARCDLHDERERIAFGEAVSGQYQDAAAICLDGMYRSTEKNQQDYWRREAWHQVHRSKNRALLDILQGARPRLRTQDLPLWEELESQFGKLDDCDHAIRNVHRRLSNTRDPTEWFSRLNQLEDERSLLARKVEAIRATVLGQINGADTFLSVDVPFTDAVQRDLRKLADQRSGPTQRTLVIEFFLLDKGILLVFLSPLWDLEALEVRQIPLAPSFTQELAMELLTATDPHIRNRTRVPDVVARSDQPSGKRLERIIDQMAVFVEPWASLLDEWQPTELIFSPHSLLNLLPIHAAPFRGKPLIEKFPVAYLPSPTLAGALCRPRNGPIKKAVLIGNPTGDLYGAEQEVKRAAKQFDHAGVKVECFLRARATSDNVQTSAPGATVLHLACHSGLDHRDFIRSGFRLSDRTMTVLEIMGSLDLTDASLAYLSSCDSARPVIGRTEELMALVRSFFYAGTQTVIASLWPLDDGAGCVFAESFYNALLFDRLSLIRSFQYAMLETKKKAPDPLSWAPFIIAGAW